MPDFFLDIDPNTILATFAKGGATKDLLNQNTGKDTKVTDSGSGQVAEIFTAIQGNLNSDLVTKTGAIFQFNVKGEEKKLFSAICEDSQISIFKIHHVFF